MYWFSVFALDYSRCSIWFCFHFFPIPCCFWKYFAYLINTFTFELFPTKFLLPIIGLFSSAVIWNTSFQVQELWEHWSSCFCRGLWMQPWEHKKAEELHRVPCEELCECWSSWGRSVLSCTSAESLGKEGAPSIPGLTDLPGRASLIPVCRIEMKSLIASAFQLYNIQEFGFCEWLKTKPDIENYINLFSYLMELSSFFYL